MKPSDVIAASESFAMRVTSSLSLWIGLEELAAAAMAQREKHCLGVLGST